MTQRNVYSIFQCTEEQQMQYMALHYFLNLPASMCALSQLGPLFFDWVIDSQTIFIDTVPLTTKIYTLLPNSFNLHKVVDINYDLIDCQISHHGNWRTFTSSENFVDRRSFARENLIGFWALDVFWKETYL